MLQRAFATPVVVVLLAAGLFAQEFSADMVTTRKEGAAEHQAKIFVGDHKIRIEGNRQEGERGMGGGAFIVDESNQTTTILIPERKMYIQSTPEQNRAGYQNMQALFRPTDPNNACPQWQAAMEAVKNEKKLTSCRKIGTDIVNGRAAVKYEGVNSDGEKGYVWVDPKLRFFLKMVSNDGTTEMRNIKEGTQPASLFEPPSDYTKFDMGSMMRNRQGGRKPPQ
jgi:hypothetical protein